MSPAGMSSTLPKGYEDGNLPTLWLLLYTTYLRVRVDVIHALRPSRTKMHEQKRREGENLGVGRPQSGREFRQSAGLTLNFKQEGWTRK